MTKILMTSVRDDERAAIKQFAQEHDVEIITTPKLIDDAVNLTAGVDGLVIQQRSPVDPAVYPQLKANGLKQIATRTAGFDMVDIQAAHDNGLTVTNVPAYSPRSVAEHALMQIFRLLRKSYRFDTQVASGDFRWFSDRPWRFIRRLSGSSGSVGLAEPLPSSSKRSVHGFSALTSNPAKKCGELSTTFPKKTCSSKATWSPSMST